MEETISGKMNVQQVADKLKSFGISELDANLVTDCINVGKSCSWQNNDPITGEAVLKARDFIKENGFGIHLDVFDSGRDKFIWEVKLLK